MSPEVPAGQLTTIERTPGPKESNYSGVVYIDSVRIVLTYAALNDVDVTAADIKNAYLQAPYS